MAGRLLLVAGLFAIVFAAGVGQSVGATHGDPVAGIVDDLVAGDRADAGDADRPDGVDATRATAAGSSDDETGPASDGSTGGADAANGSEGASTGPPFRFEIESIERCGRTCRDVTATLVNGQDASASDLVVETAIYAGNDTDDGDRVWRGTERVETLAAGAEHTSTRTVDLGWGGGLAVKRADGWITVETTVETAARTVTLERQREVA